MVSWEEQPLPRSFDSVFYGAAGTPTGVSDDEFNRVSFMSHFEGANNGVNNAFDDGSTSNHTITAVANVTQGSFGPFARPDGEWGVDFDGSGDTLSVPASSDFSPGAGDFTLEAFVNLGIAGSSIAWHQNNSSGAQVNLTGSTALNANQWYHIAVVINSNTLKLYVDGTSDGSVTNNEVFNNNDVMTIGGNADHIGATNSMGFVNKGAAGGSSNKWFLYFAGAGGGITFKGQISNLRFVKGTAVYTGDFTAPTSKLTAITNTKLLTCQSNRFVDNSASGHTVTPAGNAAVSAFGPFLTDAVYDPAVNGGSASFGGNASGDGLTVADSSDFELGSGDFTLAMWVYPNNINVSESNTVAAFMLHSTYSGTGPALGWSIFWQSDSEVTNSFRLYVNGTGRRYDAEGFFGRQWTYLTAVRTGNTLKLFINGVQKVSTSFADFNNSTTSLTIGCSPNWQSDVYKFNGKMSDVFICKGTAVYTSAFTPPTAPLTNITNTKLLLNMADGQAIDSAAQNNLSLENGTNISTAQAKFGNSSLYFDGTTDTATVIGSENVNFGTGNFTVEGWIRPASFSGYKPNIISKWTNGSRGWAVRLVASGSGFVMRFTFSTQGSNDYNLDATTVLAFDTWQHFAFVQNSNTVTCYANGTANGTISCSTIFASTNPIILGDWDSNQADYNGYIDDIRVTTGFARYTSNFTAPAEPFPDKGQDA